MSRNFTLEGKIKEAATAAGALPSSLSDFENDVQTYAITSADEIPAWIAKCKTERPHRFALQSDHDIDLATRAFVGKNKTAESLLYRAVGKDRFEALKELYANGGPEEQKKERSTNPWSAESWSTAKQFSIIRSLGAAKAAELAKAAGSFLGATSPRSKNMTSFRRTG